MTPDDAEDLWLACVMQAPHYLDHSMIAKEHLSPRAQRCVAAVAQLRGEGWPQVTPGMLKSRAGDAAMRTIEPRYEMIAAAESIRQAERSLLDSWIDRELSAAMRATASRIAECGREKALAELMATQQRLLTYDGQTNWESPYEVASKWLDSEDKRARGEGPPLIHSGFDDLDYCVRHWRPEMMTVLGGYTNDGKSTAGLQILTGMALRGTSVAIISLEDAKTIPVKRQIACILEDPALSQAISADDLSIDQIQKLRMATAAKWYREQPMKIVYGPGWGVSKVCGTIQEAVRKFGVQVVMVDYLQCFPSPNNSRREVLGDAARALKAAGAEVGAHVLLVSQIVRPEGKSRAARPNLFMLKEAGDIENVADYVELVYRPQRGKDAEYEDAMWIHDKGKDSAQADIPMWWSTLRNCYQARL